MSQTETIGIVGGGQLAMMLTEAATKLGIKIIVIDPTPNCPAAQVGAEQIQADLTDAKALSTLKGKANVITIDVEHVNISALNGIEAAGAIVRPSPSTIAMIQDKFMQKIYLKKAGIKVPNFKEITDRKSALMALKYFGDKMILKTRFGAYDGRGNAVISNENDLDKALDKFSGQGIYAEEYVDFERELAVMIARSTNGDTATYPVVETIQKRNICVEVIAPAQIPQTAIKKAESLAHEVAEHLEGAGVFGIEMFHTNQGDVLVNEIAPRVHNSGHYTIESCETSQFENHIRAVAGLGLGSPELKVKAAVMFNILGENDSETNPQGISEAEQIPNTKVHLYGKSPNKIDRKMGHLTTTADTVEEAQLKAKQALSLISI